MLLLGRAKQEKPRQRLKPNLEVKLRRKNKSRFGDRLSHAVPSPPPVLLFPHPPFPFPPPLIVGTPKRSRNTTGRRSSLPEPACRSHVKKRSGCCSQNSKGDERVFFFFLFVQLRSMTCVYPIQYYYTAVRDAVS